MNGFDAIVVVTAIEQLPVLAVIGAMHMKARNDHRGQTAAAGTESEPVKVRLSDRQAAALLALDDHSVPVTGETLAGQMTANGRETTVAAAHQAASGLEFKGLAAKHYKRREPIRYSITAEGRTAAAEFRTLA